MSVFHALVEGKGINPLRLALFPVVIWLQAVVDPAASIVRVRSAVAVCAVGVVESITVTITDAGPTSAWMGFPVIVPDVALIVNPLGSPVALNV